MEHRRLIRGYEVHEPDRAPRAMGIALRGLLLAALVVAAGDAEGTGRASPDYALDRSGRQVVALSNLHPDGRCSPALTRGRIVKREFDRSDALLSSLVLEAKDGSRETVGVAMDLKSVGPADRAWIAKGLKAMLRAGTIVDLGIRLCGPGGQTVMLDSVRAP